MANEIADACFGKKAQDETFITSNLLPQPHKLNADTWRNIEKLEEKIARKEEWAIDGPVFGTRPETIGRDKVAVPDYCYKVDVFVEDGKIDVLAFEVPENTAPTTNIEQFLVPLKKLRSDTHINFFPDLPSAVESALENRDAKASWKDAMDLIQK